MKHFSEKKDAQVVPQFHPREIGPHFQSWKTSQVYQSHELVSYLSNSEEWCHFSKLGCCVSPYILLLSLDHGITPLGRRLSWLPWVIGDNLRGLFLTTNPNISKRETRITRKSWKSSAHLSQTGVRGWNWKNFEARPMFLAEILRD